MSVEVFRGSPTTRWIKNSDATGERKLRLPTTAGLAAWRSAISHNTNDSRPCLGLVDQRQNLVKMIAQILSALRVHAKAASHGKIAVHFAFVIRTKLKNAKLNVDDAVQHASAGHSIYKSHAYVVARFHVLNSHCVKVAFQAFAHSQLGPAQPLISYKDRT